MVELGKNSPDPNWTAVVSSCGYRVWAAEVVTTSSNSGTLLVLTGRGYKFSRLSFIYGNINDSILVSGNRAKIIHTAEFEVFSFGRLQARLPTQHHILQPPRDRGRLFQSGMTSLGESKWTRVSVAKSRSPRDMGHRLCRASVGFSVGSFRSFSDCKGRKSETLVAKKNKEIQPRDSIGRRYVS